MSLLDSLIRDPAPFNVWIAARTDGIKGPDTVRKPYNGSRNFSAFGNQALAGAPLSFFEDVGGGAFEGQDSLEDKINDAITLSML